MARKRMIDPNIWESMDFGELSTLSKIVFIGLFSLADDTGKGKCHPKYLKAKLFPYDEGKIRVADIDKTLSEIGSNMSVTYYSFAGTDYYRLDNWLKWQKIDKPTPSMIPDPPIDSDQNEFAEDSTSTPRAFAEDSTSTPRGLPPNRIEKNRKEKEYNNTMPDVIESHQAVESESCVFIQLPTNIPNELYDITTDDVCAWKELYPAVDVEQELRNMKAWLDANSKNRKTTSGMKRFVVGWLNKNQNKYHPSNNTDLFSSVIENENKTDVKGDF